MKKEPVIIAVCGVKNSGKTTFLEGVIPKLCQKGIKVGVIKHDGHTFEPDVPNTDSFRLRKAGANGVAVYSNQRFMVIREEPPHFRELLEQFLWADVVLLEGGKDSPFPKIELVRSQVSQNSVCSTATLLALCTDLPHLLPEIPKIGLTEYEKAVDLILSVFNHNSNHCFSQ